MTHGWQTAAIFLENSKQRHLPLLIKLRDEEGTILENKYPIL